MMNNEIDVIAFDYVTFEARLRRNSLPVELVLVVEVTEPDEGVCCELCYSESTYVDITYMIENFGLPFTERFRGDLDDLIADVIDSRELFARIDAARS